MNHSAQTKPCPKRQKQTLSEHPTKYVITDRREVLTKNKNWMSILRMQAGIDLGLIKLFNSKSQADLVVEALNRKGIQVQSLSLAEASELSLVRSACLLRDALWLLLSEGPDSNLQLLGLRYASLVYCIEAVNNWSDRTGLSNEIKPGS